MKKSLLLFKVQSSNIAGLTYLPETKQVFVMFLNGSIYSYEDVLKDEYDRLLTAKSVGTELRKSFIGKHTYAKQDAETFAVEWVN